MRALVIVGLVCLAACGGSSAATSTSPKTEKVSVDAKAGCDAAAAFRARVPALRTAGKLDRTMRALDRANGLCASSASAAWAVEIATLVDLGRADEALALAARIDAATDAPAEAKAAAAKARIDAAALASKTDRETALRAAKRLFQEGLDLEKLDAKLAKARFVSAWATSHPFGDASLHAGMAARALGETVESQRLLDRALFELERENGKPARVDVPNGLDVGAAVAFSPDGETIAVGHGSRIVLLGGPQLEERFRFEGHRERVNAVAFSPDGKWIASGSGDATLRVWDATTGAPLHEMPDFREPVDAVAFSHDGRLLAGVGEDGWMQVWDTSSWQAILRLDEHAPLFAMALSPKGDRIATGGIDGKVRVHGLPRGELVATLEGHKSGVFALAFSSDGKRLVSGSLDHTVRTWDVATKIAGRTIAGYASGLGLSRDGKLVAFGTADHAVAIWDLDSGSARAILRGHAGAISATAFSPDGKRLVSCAEDRVALLWDLDRRKTLAAVEGHGKALAVARISPRGDRLAVASHDRRILVFGGAKGVTAHDVRPDVTSALAFSPDGSLVASATPANVVELWDAESGTTKATFAVHDDAVTSLAFDPSGKILASASADKTVELTDVATGKDLGKLVGHKAAVRAVSFSPDGHLVATGSADFDARLWDAGRLVSLLELEHGDRYDVTGVAFSPDGRTLATASRGDTLWTFDTKTGKTILTIAATAGAVQDVAFSRDGTVIATSSRDGAARAYRVSNGKYLRRLDGSRAPVVSVSFSPRRDLLAAASADGSVFLFGVEEGALVATVRVVAGSAGGYVFTADGFVDVLGERAGDVAPVCRVGAKGYPFDLCEERASSPGLLSKILAGDASYGEP